MNGSRVKELKRDIQRLVDEKKIPPLTKQGFRRVKRHVLKNPKKGLDLEGFIQDLIRIDLENMWNNATPEEKAKMIEATRGG